MAEVISVSDVNHGEPQFLITMFLIKDMLQLLNDYNEEKEILYCFYKI